MMESFKMEPAGSEGVLVIDDNEVTRNILKMIFEEEGFRVDCCSGGGSAFDMTKERSFEIYVVDYSMPEMKGDMITSELRRLYPDAYIIGYSIEPKEQTFLDAGADKFIIKDELTSELIPLIRKRKSRN